MMRALLRALAPLLVVIAFSCSTALAAPPLLPPLGGEIARAWMTDVTDNGIVVGVFGPYRAFMWRNGIRTMLEPELPSNYSMPVAVNRHGQVVGFEIDQAGRSLPILWDRGQRVDLMAGFPPHRDAPGEGVALGINDRGQVVFVAQPEASCQCPNAYLWDRRGVTELGPTTAWVGLSYGERYWNWKPILAINQHGDVIGDDYGGSFFWRDGVRTALPFRATALNDRGQVVGGPFLWERGELTHLAVPSILQGTFAQVINGRGEVAGILGPNLAPDPFPGELRVFRWRNGAMEVMPAPGWLARRALAVTDIDEGGRVVGVDNIYDMVGYLTTAPDPSLFLWDGDRVVNLEAGVGPIGYPITGRGPRLTGGRVTFNHVLDNDAVIYRWEDGVTTPLRVKADAHAVPSLVPLLTPRPPSFGIHVSPNPASGPVQLRFELPEAASARVTVLDLQGRRVRSFATGGERVLTWDGRDDDGQPTAPGIYVLRVETGGAVHSTRLLRIR
jgi:uncharacterized membrane protein